MSIAERIGLLATADLGGKLKGLKLASHVLWYDGITIEVVASFEKLPIESGFVALYQYVEDYVSNANINAEEVHVYRSPEPGCNAAILIVQILGCRYQLNFVELV